MFPTDPTVYTAITALPMHSQKQMLKLCDLPSAPNSTQWYVCLCSINLTALAVSRLHSLSHSALHTCAHLHIDTGHISRCHPSISQHVDDAFPSL